MAQNGTLVHGRVDSNEWSGSKVLSYTQMADYRHSGRPCDHPRMFHQKHAQVRAGPDRFPAAAVLLAS